MMCTLEHWCESLTKQHTPMLRFLLLLTSRWLRLLTLLQKQSSQLDTETKWAPCLHFASLTAAFVQHVGIVYGVPQLIENAKPTMWPMNSHQKIEYPTSSVLMMVINFAVYTYWFLQLSVHTRMLAKQTAHMQAHCFHLDQVTGTVPHVH